MVGDPAYSRAMGRRLCLRKSSLRASPSRDWTVRPWVAPSMRSSRWTAWETWPAILTLPGPRFLEGRRGAGRGIHGRDDERLRTEREHGQAAAPTTGERPPVSPQGYRSDPVHCLRQIVGSIPDSPA